MHLHVCTLCASIDVNSKNGNVSLVAEHNILTCVYLCNVMKEININLGYFVSLQSCLCLSVCIYMYVWESWLGTKYFLTHSQG